ncbi:MAG: hypothetical protein DRG87_05605 [Deltaproteobacteria bacterium]|nr:hypothetical protein [Deltaproteobacteria bacterium]MBW2311529.1 hypothetical protein [Deltaproteobacteria bacterium]RLB30235.1 MAG: hypothetical protein DRG87_05605 [Deltaproteobacteria bacterium]
MGFRFKVSLVFIMGVVAGIILPGCISYQFVRQLRGVEIMPPDNRLKPGRTTLGEVLSIYGAPDNLEEFGGEDLLLYERILYGNSGLSLGIPFSDFTFFNPELSARGRLGRYDTLAVFFSSDGILREMVYTKGSSYPYLKTLFEEERATDGE